MKTKSMINRGYCFVLACSLVFCTMCKKKDSETTASSQSQRITNTSYYFNDTLTGTSVYNYSGTLLSEVIGYTSGMEETSKEVFQYTGNTILSYTSYEKKNGALIKKSFYEISGYSGDNPSEIISHEYYDEGNEAGQSKKVYTYEGSVLKKMDSYSYYSGTWEKGGTTTFIYDSIGRILKEVDTTGTWGIITTFIYDSDHMTNAITQNYSDGTLTNSTKVSYEYMNSLVSSAISYRWESETWNKIEDDQYEYNESGNPVNMGIEYTGLFRLKITFKYGEGTGNYRQCMKVFGVEGFLPGNPSPYPVKSPNHQFKKIGNARNDECENEIQ